jgi:hypothetical protein
MKLIYDYVDPSVSAYVEIGDRVTSSRNENFIVTGWREPQHAGSTGRVWVKFAENGKFEQEFFPGVFDLKFV